jgi:DNA adenine methylase
MSRYKTPLRYPGGKQKLSPFIHEFMVANSLDGGHYIEPYAGGAGVAMDLLLDRRVTQVHLNDACKGVYAFWRSILTKTEQFCRRISSASLTVEEWRRQKDILSRPREHNQLDIGFSMFFLNRCNRSGIPSGGLIGGLKQDGKWKMDARFPRNELIRRIEAIALLKKSIKVKNWDAEQFILEYIPKVQEKALVYCDPPYYHKAGRLYLNHYQPEDHARIARVIQKCIKHPWIVSYDGVPEILKHYSKSRSFQYNLQYSAAKARLGTEVFFFAKRLKLPAYSDVPFINLVLERMSA